jgi:hypothetical protein
METERKKDREEEMRTGRKEEIRTGRKKERILEHIFWSRLCKHCFQNISN